jgi:hypothetical protein
MTKLRDLHAMKKMLETGTITAGDIVGGVIKTDQIVVHEVEEGHQLTDWQETANKKLEIEKQRFGDSRRR